MPRTKENMPDNPFSDILKDCMPYADTARFMGVIISEMTRDELQAALIHVGKGVRKLTRSMTHDTDDTATTFAAAFARLTTFKPNRFHPLVWIHGDPDIGDNVSIGAFSEVNATKAHITIGDNCDIASFVAINAADSHLQTLGLTTTITRCDITLEHNVFVGSHCVIKGGAYIGHHTVVAAGTVVDAVTIPSYSLVSGNPMTVKERYYVERIKHAR